MRIQHRVSFGLINGIRLRLEELGIAYIEAAMAFDIEESDERWPAVKAMLSEFNGIDICTTLFDEEECRSAEWLTVSPEWHYGYPMPDHDFGYLQQVYDSSGSCGPCGINGLQVAPFWMRGEPRWGRRHILQLNWVFDEYFVRPEVWKEVFLPLGIQCLPVLHHKTGAELETVVQLKIEHVLDSVCDLGDHPFEVCADCGRKKWLPFVRGVFPEPSQLPATVPAVKTQEWFGSGASARRKVLVSQAVYSSCLAHGLRGVSFGVVGPKWRSIRRSEQ